MIKKMRPRYYCEHCKKSGGSAYWIQRHEDACTRNPNRVCGMCKFGEQDQHSIPELIEALGGGDAAGVERLGDLADYCPACMLAAIKQSGIQRRYVDEDDQGFSVPFNFAKAKQEFWECHWEARPEDPIF